MFADLRFVELSCLFAKFIFGETQKTQKVGSGIRRWIDSYLLFVIVCNMGIMEEFEHEIFWLFPVLSKVLF